MWIGSRIRFTARQPYASPLGGQSLTSGDNVPDPGSQDTVGAQLHHGSVPPSSSHNINSLVNSTPCLLHSGAHWEDANASLISQWWGHHGLHQDEVLECKSLIGKHKVSLIAEICWLTTIPRLPIACVRTTPSEEEALVDLTEQSIQEPSLAWYSAAFEGNDIARSDNDTSSSLTLCEDRLIARHVPKPWLARTHTASKGRDSFEPSNNLKSSLTLITLTPKIDQVSLTLPNDTSYAHSRCVRSYQTQDSVYSNCPKCMTLASTNPVEFPLCHRPDHQPPPFKPSSCQQTSLPLSLMSTQTLTAGDESSKAKVCN